MIMAPLRLEWGHAERIFSPRAKATVVLRIALLPPGIPMSIGGASIWNQRQWDLANFFLQRSFICGAADTVTKVIVLSSEKLTLCTCLVSCHTDRVYFYMLWRNDGTMFYWWLGAHTVYIILWRNLNSRTMVFMRCSMVIPKIQYHAAKTCPLRKNKTWWYQSLLGGSCLPANYQSKSKTARQSAPSRKNEEPVDIYKVIYVVISAEAVYTRHTGYFKTGHTRGQQTAEMNKQTLNRGSY